MVRVSIGLDTDNVRSTLLIAVAVGILNATLRPVLGFVAFPITFLTFGLFSIILNAIVLYATAALVKGFHINGCVNAIIAAVVLGILNGLIFWILAWFGL